jgi:SNF2 family DNA or RNA helicase
MNKENHKLFSSAFYLFSFFFCSTIPVVIDPQLTAQLRPHQVKGVQFLFDTVGLGFEDPGTKRRFYGAMLADGMGLGKTIQAVTTIWTFIRQSPNGAPYSRKACIVCPSSLVANWGKEFEKWIPGKIKALLIQQSNKKCKNEQQTREANKRGNSLFITSFGSIGTTGTV